MWDVVYWTWITMVLVAVSGDGAWWLWGAVPAYSVWLLFKAWRGFSGGTGGMGAGTQGQGQGQNGGGGESKRQKKLEKRGGEKVVYR